MNWLKRIAQQYDHANAEHYFSIGHGDFNEEHGYEPQYYVWALINGSIEIGPLGEDEEDSSGGTHGSLWGHVITDRTYKGRYEPETGRLSIAKPEKHKYRSIPSAVMQLLHTKFKDIGEVSVF